MKALGLEMNICGTQHYTIKWKATADLQSLTMSADRRRGLRALGPPPMDFWTSGMGSLTPHRLWKEAVER